MICNSITKIESIKERQESEPQIYWEVNGLKQDDPDLIKFIREEILIPPYLPPKGTCFNQFTNRIYHYQSPIFIKDEFVKHFLYFGIKGSLKTTNRLNLTNRVLTRRSLKGQFGQSILVEKLLKLEKKQKGNIYLNKINPSKNGFIIYNSMNLTGI